MSTTTHAEDTRINLRLKYNAKQMLERAASFEGQTVSKFVLNSALASAEKTIQKHQVIQLNASDSEAFLSALESPVRFNGKLAAAFEEHDHLVTSK